MQQSKVFISSILDPKKEELGPEREVIRDVIESFGFLTAWAFEHEPASTAPLEESYLQNVDESDLVVLIVGKECTDPVVSEYLRAVKRSKPVLVFVKDMAERTPQAELLLRRLDCKYDAFDSLTDLRGKVRDALSQTLVKGLKSLAEGVLAGPSLGTLRQFAARLATVRIKPTIPRKAESEKFQLRVADSHVVVVAMLSSGAEVRIPTGRIKEVLSFGNSASGEDPILILDGRLQRVTRGPAWRFFPEVPEQDCELGFPKTMHLDNPHTRCLLDELKQAGWQINHPYENFLDSFLAGGSELFYDEDGRYVRTATVHSNKLGLLVVMKSQ